MCVCVCSRACVLVSVCSCLCACICAQGGDTSPTSLRAIVRPEVQQREKTMMTVRDTFRSHQWGEEMKRMQKTSRRRAELDRGNYAYPQTHIHFRRHGCSQARAHTCKHSLT